MPSYFLGIIVAITRVDHTIMESRARGNHLHLVRVVTWSSRLTGAKASTGTRETAPVNRRPINLGRAPTFVSEKCVFEIARIDDDLRIDPKITIDEPWVTRF